MFRPGRNTQQNVREALIEIDVVEQDETLRETLAKVINDSDGFRIVNTYASYPHLLKYLKQDRPHVVVGSMYKSARNWNVTVENLKKIKNELASAKLLIFSELEEEEDVIKVLHAGADGYITKDTPYPKLLNAIRDLHIGGAPLTPRVARKIVRSFHKQRQSPLSQREMEVLTLMVKGRTYSCIADELFVSYETVRTHVRKIFTKLNVDRRSKAIEKALQEKMV